MASQESNYAFIDNQNLNRSIKDQGWQLDLKKFRIHLREKYSVTKAFMFLGYIAENEKLYSSIRASGFICIFKPIYVQQDGSIKGNCDAELVLQSMIEYKNYNKAIVVTGDGDFHCLIKFLIKKDKLKALLVPDKNKFSALLKYKAFQPYLRFVNELRQRLQYLKI